MKLVVGLGNPGPRYEQSRHNIGFWVVDELARRWRCDVTRFDKHFEGLTGQARRGGDDVLLLKPMTFMNLSGRSAAAAWRYYKLSLDDLLVVYDDLDLPVGQLRIRAQGSSGGHNGMTDVLRHLGSDAVGRIRIGIGKTHRAATVEHVLGKFAPDEREAVNEAAVRAADAVEMWLSRGLATAMNEFNRKRTGSAPEGTGASEGE